MSDQKDLLKAMLHDVINDRHDQATSTMHDYFVSKSRDVSGITKNVPEDSEDSDSDFDQD